MSIRQSLIDLLAKYPGPTEAEARRWRYALMAMGAFALLAEGVLVYILYYMDPAAPPFWLAAPAGWLWEHVPAARGFTNSSYGLRAQMPYVFVVFFLLVIATAALVACCNRRGSIFGMAVNFLQEGIFRQGVILVAVPIVYYAVAFFVFSSDLEAVSSPSERSYRHYGLFFETEMGVATAWVPLALFCGSFIGVHLSMIAEIPRLLRAARIG
ncbi:hypothetical protein TK90_0113 [Thioalkalivibrio sp. K90mix]|uniref:hypothetical protein n=1 Tax=Thioalkalivibrio sp. (strain K90mix) TaxID=396595 RepID=UPI000195A65C|nr:hypothetical protein [Thioalkalivibrio sp. K90mix]ADC70629.1 hypothetical protein TK90_0113 [Thioalkalivibrio sp. K90mix]